tara:strand:+ start:648 stop:935 length:288 start_codon:yes stop_codon:yes gene_type:complete
MSEPVCPFCERSIPKGVPQSLHHLIPRSKGGKGGETVLLHHQCHKEIHATLNAGELARQFNTVQALKTHPRLAKYIKWVSKRPPSFLSRTKMKRR